MTRDELVTEIRNKLGYNTGLTESYITTAIDNAQDLLEQEPELPWFLETEISSISTVADEERIPVPSDYIRSIPDNPLWYFNTSGSGAPWIEIVKESMGTLRAWQAGQIETEREGAPQAYALQGKYFRLFPTPDAVYTIKHIYYKTDDKMTTGAETNEWATEAPYMLIGKAGMLLTLNSRNVKSQALFGGIYQDAAMRLGFKSEAREHAGAVYVRGGAD